MNKPLPEGCIECYGCHGIGCALCFNRGYVFDSNYKQKLLNEMKKDLSKDHVTLEGHPKQTGGSKIERKIKDAKGPFGMSLKDWFAGLALSSMKLIVLGEHFTGKEIVKICDNIAESAYSYAEAMINMRNDNE